MKENAQRIDAHHHLWDLSLNKNSWLFDEDEFLGDLSTIRDSYSIDKYKIDTHNYFAKSVHIQAGWDSTDAVGESRWLNQLHEKMDNLSAIVAFADLSKSNCHDILEQQAEISLVKGIRQIVAWHELSKLNCCPENYLENPIWRKNFKILKKYDFSFDLQIYPGQTDSAYLLAKENPHIKIVIEHGLQPLRADDEYLKFWRIKLHKLAQLPNVYIKVSGFVMFHRHLDEKLLRVFITAIVDAFTPDRCMIGTNFPVDMLFIKPNTLLTLHEKIINDFSTCEADSLWGKTARFFYDI